jgi:ABC-type uncharacterized transport system permease subunit
VKATRAGVLTVIAGLAAAWIAFDLIVWAYGQSPRALLGMLLAGTWGTPYGAAQVLYKATPLLFTGVATDLALRAGLFNIGGEGQVAVAGLVVGAVGAQLGATPAWIAVPLLVVVAMVAGAAWAAVPALLRGRLGVHEVISTIMMNRVAEAFVAFALGAGLAVTGTVRTPDLAPHARIPRLDVLSHAMVGSAASFATVLAVAIAFAVPWAFRRTRVLHEMALVGQNDAACRAEGIPVARRVTQALLFSGALAGLASSATVLGYKHYFESGLGAGAGFGGIAVAMLARGNPVGLVLSALLFGTLEQGGFTINALVPMEVVQVIEGVVILAVAVADTRIRASLAALLPRAQSPASEEAKA